MPAVNIPIDTLSENDLVAIITVVGNKLMEIRRKKLMTQYDDLAAALDTEGADVTAILGELAADVASIQDLNAKLATALANQAPDLTPLLAKVQAQVAAMAAQLPAPAPAA